MRLLALLLATSLFAADAPKAKAPAAPKPPEPPVYLTEKEATEAGEDPRLQGEFANAKMGADVIALGKGEYRLVLFKGGLPGAGWDGTPKIEVEGKRDGATVTFQDSIDSATLTDGVLKIKSMPVALKRTIRHSPSEGLAAPKGAIILFDGKNADAWENGKVDPRGFLEANTKTKQAFTDFTLHLEFFLPFKPLGRGQGRANSGLYLQHRYEVQVLDSFGLKGLDNECGGIYKNAAPKVNMCFPPLQWQTYDVDFTAAKFDQDGKKTANAVVSVRHNGVLVHDTLELKGSTPGGAFKTEVPAPGPVFYLQGHGNPVVYRNIWVVAK
ncbi:MAG: 3-keto-disaccharide hydrolase [Opitutales bacterium]